MRRRYGLIAAAAFLVSINAWSDFTPAQWDQDPANQESLTIAPLRDTAVTADGIHLALKHYANPGAQPVLLIHGLAQNDRCWDAATPKYSFARYMHAQGYDVWIANERGAGTPGFRSETPSGPHHWTVEDYGIYDLPALVKLVRERTGQDPFLIAHSLGAWAVDGYLSGLHYTRSGGVADDAYRASARKSEIRGVITIAGVYNLWWDKPLSEAATNPIRNAVDYYHSNYELEALAKAKPLYYIVPNLPALPLGWIGSVLTMPLGDIPFIGKLVEGLYVDFQDSVIQTPVLSMFFYPPNIDPNTVRLHGQDGLEDLGPHLVEQLANTINDGKREAYYHLDRPNGVYVYDIRRSSEGVPMLFVAGDRDRLANADMIYRDGYEAAASSDKQYIRVIAGHLDILSGLHAATDVMDPTVRWMRAHQ